MKPLAWITIDKNGKPAPWCKVGILDPAQWANPTQDSDAADKLSPELAPHKTIPLYTVASLRPTAEDGLVERLLARAEQLEAVDEYDDKLLREAAAALSGRAADEADAKRYRWLRDGPNTWDVDTAPPGVEGDPSERWSIYFSADPADPEDEKALDKVIDAAIAAHRDSPHG